MGSCENLICGKQMQEELPAVGLERELFYLHGKQRYSRYNFGHCSGTGMGNVAPSR